MQFAVLGPLEVRVAGVPLELGGSKPRLLLAILLLRRNQVVPADKLVELLWASHPPRTASNVLQAHVAAVRRALKPAAPRGPSRLETRDPGYLLAVEPDELDAATFERLSSEARGVAGRDADAAISMLRTALGLWRGGVLDGLDAPAELRPELARLDELRLAAMERLVEIELGHGGVDSAAADLERLVADHPLRERLLWLRMIALYRQGRQADALAAYRDGRRVIVEELGLEPGPELQALERAILTHDEALLGAPVPAAPTGLPAAPAERRRHNLPAEVTSFIGRSAELEAVADLLDEGRRLVTITGVGGTGKTRLVRELGRATADRWPDGVWLVDLTPVATGDRIIDAIAVGLEVREQAGRPLLDSVVGFLRHRRLLLILDDCEPLIGDCARISEALLRAAPEVSILASSREPMRVGGETTWQLAPLAVPDAGETDPARLAASEAVQLLLERARVHDPRRHVDAVDLRILAAIAVRLEGIPLAIEMAAARLTALSPAEILARLDDRFRLLTRGARTAASRHRTLRATLDWSYDLLNTTEQVLLRRFSVFAGSVELTHVAAVCGGEGVQPEDLIDLLTGLVDRSLVVASPIPGGATRYRVLDTVREYGRVRLRETGEESALLRRHLEWCTASAEAAHLGRVGREGEMVAMLTADLDELRSALERADSVGSGHELRLAGWLGWYWGVSGRLSEGRQRTERALASGGDDVDRARALTAVGTVAGLMGDTDANLSRLEEALQVWRALGDRAEECATLDTLGWAHFWPGHDAQALDAFRRGGAVARASRSAALINRLMAGECQVLVAMGDVERARPLATELVQMAPERDLRTAHLGHHFLADCALIDELCAEAACEYAVSLALALRMGDPVEACFEVQGVAMAHAGLGHAREALLLGGAAEAALATLEMNLAVPFWLALLEKWMGRARATLGMGAAAVWDEGRGLTLEAATGLALGLPGNRPQNPLSRQAAAVPPS